MANVDKTVTNVALARETGTAVTAVALTSDAAGDNTETLIITPTCPANRIILIVNEVLGGGTMTVNVAAGDYWAALAMTEVSISASTSKAFIFQAAMHQDKDDNTIEVVIAPASGLKLKTNHGATWQIMQMPD